MDKLTLTIGALASFGAMLLAYPEADQPASYQSVVEDDPAWDCTTMGNRICGPSNAQGAVAGCFDEGGVLVAPWPCTVVVNPDGSADVYGP